MEVPVRRAVVPRARHRGRLARAGVPGEVQGPLHAARREPHRGDRARRRRERVLFPGRVSRAEERVVGAPRAPGGVLHEGTVPRAREGGLEEVPPGAERDARARDVRRVQRPLRRGRRARPRRRRHPRRGDRRVPAPERPQT